MPSTGRTLGALCAVPALQSSHETPHQQGLLSSHCCIQSNRGVTELHSRPGVMARETLTQMFSISLMC